MSRLFIKTARYTFFGNLVATSAWTFAVYKQSSKVDRWSVETIDGVSEAFAKSAAHRLVNPRGFQHTADSRSIRLKLPSGSTVFQDQILVWMVDGFFQSWAFAPEALALRVVSAATGENLTRISGLPDEVPQSIWSTNQLPQSSLPPVNTLLFGAFQIADIWQNKLTSERKECGVDLVFGSDLGTFSGCHRLSIARDKESLHLEFACVTCNPTEGESKSLTRRFPFMLTFHKMYSEHLFRAAVGNVLRQLEERSAEAFGEDSIGNDK